MDAKDYLWNSGWIRLNTKPGYIETPKFITKEQEKKVKLIKEVYSLVETEHK